MFSIVSAEFRHLEQLALLFDEYRQFYGQTSDVDAASTYLHQRIQNKDSVIFVALDERQNILGFTQLYPCFSSIALQKIWILNDLYVALKVRKQGVASTLIQHALQFSKESGSVRMELKTENDNLNAQALYERLNFAKEEKFTHYWFVHDQP